jgi:hypothetical protein
VVEVPVELSLVQLVQPVQQILVVEVVVPLMDQEWRIALHLQEQVDQVS